MTEKDFEETAEAKLRHLREVLSSPGSICIAHSGGVDSTFLLKVPKDVLGETDLKGYRTGSMNEMVEAYERRKA